MRKISLTLVAFCAAALSLSGWAQEKNPDGKAPKDNKGLDQALSEKEQGKLGLFVVTQLDNGVRGEALADAIHQEQALLKAERDQDKDKDKDKDKPKDKPDADSDKTGGKNGPGEALKHGLSDKDLTNFGKFVNEQLAAGLRGEALADAIQKRHEELKAARTAENTADHQPPPPPHRDRHRSAGRH